MQLIYRIPIVRIPLLPIPGGVRLPPRLRKLRRIVLVSRTSDVREVLANDRGIGAPFSVTDYGEHMRETVGDFFLGMDQTYEGTYDEEKALATSAFLKSARPGTPGYEAVVDELTGIAREAAERAILRVRSGKRREIDVVADLAEEVPVRLVERYFGIRDGGGTLLADCQQISFYIFNFLSEIPGLPTLLRLRGPAREAGARLRESIGSQVRQRWVELQTPPSPPSPSDMLDRLLLSSPDPPDVEVHLCRVRRILTGMISGTLVATVGLFVSAVDRLMDLPGADRRGLSYAALASLVRRDDAELWRFLREAGRFGAVPPFVFRRCRAEYTLARGCARAIRLREHDLVVVSPMLAGRDPYRFGESSEFRLDRPADSYTLFGYGLHACIGEFLGRILLVQMAAHLFSLRGLERDRRLGRRVSYRGSPRRLVLTFLPA